MKFSVIIPVFNSGAKISTTLESLLSQRIRYESFRCLVVDGGSSDDTLAHVQSFDDERIEVISEPDDGMYDALAKGLRWASGDVTCYLPAGEQFDPHAFSVVAQILDKYRSIDWITGRAVTRNASGEITDSVLPHPIDRRYLDCGMYGTRLMAVQQESTFWRTKLNKEFDLEALKSKKLAGDYYLWRTLAQKHELYVVNTQLGSFTIEPNQLSKSIPGGYRKELRSIRRRPSMWERFRALVHRQFAKRLLPKRTGQRLISYDHDLQEWRLAKH